MMLALGQGDSKFLKVSIILVMPVMETKMEFSPPIVVFGTIWKNLVIIHLKMKKNYLIFVIRPWEQQIVRGFEILKRRFRVLDA